MVQLYPQMDTDSPLVLNCWSGGYFQCLLQLPTLHFLAYDLLHWKNVGKTQVFLAMRYLGRESFKNSLKISSSKSFSLLWREKRDLTLPFLERLLRLSNLGCRHSSLKLQSGATPVPLLAPQTAEAPEKEASSKPSVSRTRHSNSLLSESVIRLQFWEGS